MRTKSEIIADHYPIGSVFSVDDIAELLYPDHYTKGTQERVKDRSRVKRILEGMQYRGAIVLIEERCSECGRMHRTYEVVAQYQTNYPASQPKKRKPKTARQIEIENVRQDVYRAIATSDKPITVRQIVREIWPECSGPAYNHHTDDVRIALRTHIKKGTIVQHGTKAAVDELGHIAWLKCYKLAEGSA